MSEDCIHDWRKQDKPDQVGSHSPTGCACQILQVQTLERIPGHMRPETPHRKIRHTEDNKYTDQQSGQSFKLQVQKFTQDPCQGSSAHSQQTESNDATPSTAGCK